MINTCVRPFVTRAAALATAFVVLAVTVGIFKSAPAAAATSYRTLRGTATLASGDTIPINITVQPNSVAGGSSVTVSVTVGPIPTGGGSVLVNCDQHSVLASPSGSWPYTLNYAYGGGNTKTFTATTSTVSSNTTVHVGACASDVDSSNSANWAVSDTLTVTH